MKAQIRRRPASEMPLGPLADPNCGSENPSEIVPLILQAVAARKPLQKHLIFQELAGRMFPGLRI